MKSALIVAMSTITVAISSASPGAAQVQISPSIGLYVPHGTSLIEAPHQFGDRTTLRKKAVGGPVFTTRVAALVGSHFGFEGSVAYSPALIAVRSASGSVRDIDQRLVLASARSILRINPDSLRATMQFHIASGVGLVSRSGAAWADTPQSGTAVAIVLGAGGQTRLGLRAPARVVFRFELEDYISWLDFDTGLNNRARPRLYHDLIWSLGLGFPIWIR